MFHGALKLRRTEKSRVLFARSKEVQGELEPHPGVYGLLMWANLNGVMLVAVKRYPLAHTHFGSVSLSLDLLAAALRCLALALPPRLGRISLILDILTHCASHAYYREAIAL